MANESRSGRSSQVYLRNENEIPFFSEFPFPKPTSRSHSVSVRNTFVAVGYNFRSSLNYALFWHNLNLLEVSEVNLSIPCDED